MSNDEDGGYVIPFGFEDHWHLWNQSNPFRQPMTDEERAELDRWWVAYNRPHRRLVRWIKGGWKDSLHRRLYPDHEDE